jgi:integrase
VQSSYRVFPYRGRLYAEWTDEVGRRRRRSLGTGDPGQVQRQVVALDRRVKSESIPDVVTVRYAWDGKRASLGDRAAGQSMNDYSKAVLSFFGELPADSITEKHCADYIAARRRAGRADGTIIGELKKLRASLNWAEKKRLITKAPFVWKPAAPPPRDKRLTRAEAERLLAACDYPHIKLFVILALTTAARLQAILELTWDRVDFDAGLIRFVNPDRTLPSKMRTTVPMNRTLRDALTEARRAATCDRVIEWSSHGIRDVDRSLHRIAAACGLPWVTAHVFRHSAASWLAESGIPMQEIAQFLGHRDSRLTERVYAKMSPTYMQRQTQALELRVPL